MLGQGFLSPHDSGFFLPWTDVTKSVVLPSMAVFPAGL